MEEVTFTNVRSQLPVMDDGANNSSKKYVLKRHKKPRLVVMSYKEYQELVNKTGSSVVMSTEHTDTTD